MTRQKWLCALFAMFACECHEDVVGLWAILWKVRQIRPRIADDDAHQATLEVVRLLLEIGDVVAGCPEEGGFAVWSDVPSEVIGRIEREWLSLGGEPNIGDIVSFAGRKLVEVVDKKLGFSEHAFDPKTKWVHSRNRRRDGKK